MVGLSDLNGVFQPKRFYNSRLGHEFSDKMFYYLGMKVFAKKYHIVRSDVLTRKHCPVSTGKVSGSGIELLFKTRRRWTFATEQFPVPSPTLSERFGRQKIILLLHVTQNKDTALESQSPKPWASI